MHDPIWFNSFRWLPSVEHESFLDSDFFVTISGWNHRFICTGRFPITRSSSSVRSSSVWIFPITWTEEVPLLFSEQSLLCKNLDKNQEKWSEKNKRKQYGSDRFGFGLVYREVPMDRVCRDRRRLWWRLVKEKSLLCVWGSGSRVLRRLGGIGIREEGLAAAADHRKNRCSP